MPRLVAPSASGRLVQNHGVWPVAIDSWDSPSDTKLLVMPIGSRMVVAT
jgi:hypothetical protein